MSVEAWTTAAQWAAVLPTLIGFIFMVTTPVFPLEVLEKNPIYATVDQTSRDSKLMLIWVMHLFYILGLMAFNLGCLSIGAGLLQLPLEIAAIPVLTSIFAMIFYMMTHGRWFLHA